MGDSYYGFAARVPFLKAFYEGLFTVSSYTRNGLFFAPLFLLLGALCTRVDVYKRQLLRWANIWRPKVKARPARPLKSSLALHPKPLLSCAAAKSTPCL